VGQSYATEKENLFFFSRQHSFSSAPVKFAMPGTGRGREEKSV